MTPISLHLPASIATGHKVEPNTGNWGPRARHRGVRTAHKPSRRAAEPKVAACPDLPLAS